MYRLINGCEWKGWPEKGVGGRIHVIVREEENNCNCDVDELM